MLKMEQAFEEKDLKEAQLSFNELRTRHFKKVDNFRGVKIKVPRKPTLEMPTHVPKEFFLKDREGNITRRDIKDKDRVKHSLIKSANTKILKERYGRIQYLRKNPVKPYCKICNIKVDNYSDHTKTSKHRINSIYFNKENIDPSTILTKEEIKFRKKIRPARPDELGKDGKPKKKFRKSKKIVRQEAIDDLLNEYTLTGKVSETLVNAKNYKFI